MTEISTADWDEITSESPMGDAGTYLSPELRYLKSVADHERAKRLRHDAIAIGKVAAGGLLAGILTRGALQHLRAA